MWTNLKPIEPSKIVQHPYPEHKYFKDIHKKEQVVLHHTVSGPNIKGDVETWINNKDNVGTCIIIARDGVPYQLFSPKYWAYHLGSGDHNQDRRSIGIELDSWGWLKPGEVPQKFYTVYGNAVDVPVQYYPNGFRGYKYYEKYTNEQIKTVGELLLLWKDMYNIPLNYNETMWDVSEPAKKGKPGVWSHTSFRAAPGKTDAHPQPELIEMLKIVQTL